MKETRFITAAVCLIAVALLVFDITVMFREVEAQPVENPDTVSGEQKALIEEHVYGGLPSKQSLFTRKAYVLCYSADHRVPNWVAYHIKPDYFKKPPREGKFSTFRKDPDVPDPVVTGEYKGLKKKYDYARGHLIPYAVSGGDRDGDGEYAIKDLDGDGKLTKQDVDENGHYVDDDQDDIETVYQVNYMSNIAPQRHAAFNGSAGVWYKLEKYVRQELVRDRGLEVWVFAGCVFGPGEIQKVGPDKDISVPPIFYKIVIQKPDTASGTPKVLAFLFPHHRSAHGDIEDFLVSVDVIEGLTGLNFFNALEKKMEEDLESADTWDNWASF